LENNLNSEDSSSDSEELLTKVLPIRSELFFDEDGYSYYVSDVESCETNSEHGNFNRRKKEGEWGPFADRKKTVYKQKTLMNHEDALYGRKPCVCEYGSQLGLCGEVPYFSHPIGTDGPSWYLPLPKSKNLGYMNSNMGLKNAVHNREGASMPIDQNPSIGGNGDGKISLLEIIGLSLEQIYHPWLKKAHCRDPCMLVNAAIHLDWVMQVAPNYFKVDWQGPPILNESKGPLLTFNDTRIGKEDTIGKEPPIIPKGLTWHWKDYVDQMYFGDTENIDQPRFGRDAEVCKKMVQEVESEFMKRDKISEVLKQGYKEILGPESVCLFDKH